MSISPHTYAQQAFATQMTSTAMRSHMNFHAVTANICLAHIQPPVSGI